MPTYKITDPETGKTLKLTGESPPTEQELIEIFSQYGGSTKSLSGQTTQQDQPDAQGNYPIPDFEASPEEAQQQELARQQRASEREDRSLIDKAVGVADAGLSVLSGGAASVAAAPAGIYGAIQDVIGNMSPDEAEKLYTDTLSNFTYQPRTKEGKEYLGDLGEATEFLPPNAAVGTKRRVFKEAGDVENLTQSAKSAVNYAKENKLPIYESDINQPRTFIGKGARGIAEKVPFAGTGGNRASQAEARQGAVRSFIDDYENISEADIVNSLRDSQSSKSKVMGKRYDDISSKMGSVKIKPNNTIKAIDNELSRLNQAGKVKDGETISKLEDLKSDIESGYQDFKGMRENRTLIREKLKSEDPSKTMSQRTIDKVYNGMTDDIRGSVSQVLGENEARRLKQVDKALFNAKNEVKKTKLKNVLNKGDVKPEEVKKMLLSGDDSEAKTLYRNLNNNGRSNVRGFLVSQLSEAFSETESTAKFLQRAKKLENQFETFFKGEDKQNYQNLLNYLKQTKQAEQAGVHNANGQQLMTLFTAAPIAADLSSTGGFASGAAATIGLMGRALENRAIRTNLRKLKKYRPHTPEYNQALISMDNAVKTLQEDKDQ